MAILERRNIKINPIDLPQNDKVAVGVTFPFDGPAVFNSSYTTKEQVKSNLINLLLTTPGERLMNPTFGVGIRNLLFEQVIEILLFFDVEATKSMLSLIFGLLFIYPWYFVLPLPTSAVASLIYSVAADPEL